MDTIKTAADWAQDMSTLRDIKPRPLAKLFGTNGPSPTQLAQWTASTKTWNAAYRFASRQQKAALASQ